MLKGVEEDLPCFPSSSRLPFGRLGERSDPAREALTLHFSVTRDDRVREGPVTLSSEDLDPTGDVGPELDDKVGNGGMGSVGREDG